jgi:hypothetical protein
MSLKGRNMQNRIPTVIPKHSINGEPARNGHSHKKPSTPVSDGGRSNGKSDTEPKQKPPDTPPPNAERTASGQFAKGNKCSLGNPFARRLGALRSAFLNAVTDADVAAVARKLADLAASGDVQAAALFLSYAVGKPATTVNPDRLDLDEFALLDAAPTRARMLAAMLTAIDPLAAAKFIRVVIQARSADSQSALKTDKEVLRAVLAEEEARIGKPIV